MKSAFRGKGTVDCEQKMHQDKTYLHLKIIDNHIVHTLFTLNPTYNVIILIIIELCLVRNDGFISNKTSIVQYQISYNLSFMHENIYQHLQPLSIEQYWCYSLSKTTHKSFKFLSDGVSINTHWSWYINLDV